MSNDNRARNLESAEPLLDFQGVSAGYGRETILRELTWTLRPGRSWALLGDNGSGKSTLLRLIRGDLMPLPGRGSWFYRGRTGPQRSPIGFKERTRLVSSDLVDAYRRNGWDIPCLEVVLSGYGDTVYVQEKPGREMIEAGHEALERAGLAHLVGAGFNTLSQGQAKRVLMARALVARPEILLLDEVCEGLDGPSRAVLRDLAQEAAENGTQIIQAAHRLRELVPAVSEFLRLESGRVAEQGRVRDIRRPPISRRFPLGSASGSTQNMGPDKARAGQELFHLKGVDVFIHNKHILKNLDWSLRQGQHWAVLGANGAGKSTLLRLLGGDLRPALGGVVIRFSDPGLKNIWHLRRRASLVSAHTQAAHKYPETVLRAALSGFKGGIGITFEPTPDQLHKARHWLDFFGLDHLIERKVPTLSYGQLRRVLLARAMVTEPEILLLDEPTGGLDSSSRKIFLGMIEKLAADGRSIVQATHYQDELAPCITHQAFLENGEIASQGMV